MQGPCDQSHMNSSGDGVLDREFRQMLWSIKQYIPYINSNYQLAIYRSWLEKLSLAHSEKMERNVYLSELSRQIKNNTILPPFDQPPPPGSLKDLPKITHFRSSNIEFQTCNQHLRWPDQEISFQAPPITEKKGYGPIQHCHGTERAPYSSFGPGTTNAMSYSSQMDSVDNFYYNLRYDDDDEEINDTLEDKLRNFPRIKKRRPKSSLHLQTPLVLEKNNPGLFDEPSKCEENNVPEESPSKDVAQNEEVILSGDPIALGVKDDSSWCDLTDSSITSIANSFASGDCENPKGMVVQERVQRINELRKVTKESGTEMDDIGKVLQGVQQTKSSCKLNPEDDSLKKRENLTEVKLSLKDTNFISADWKKTIEALQLRLTETMNQNNELKAIISAMQIKMKDEVMKIKDQNQKISSELHNKEIQALKQLQAENVKKLEKSFQIKLDEAERTCQQKVDKIKTTYDGKVKELKAEREHVKKEKNKEIVRLTEIVQQQCTKMSNEIAALRHQIENSMSNTNEEKIVVLQKCVSKMDKLFQKSEKEYQKQLEKMKQEIELKDKVMQIQLKTQRAELIARTSAEKQKQFEDVVNNLEVKYIKMLEYHEAQVMESRKHDEEKIDQLVNLLEKNDISYDCV